MSLPAVRLVLARAAAGEAARCVLAAELSALGTCAAMGSKEAAKEFTAKISELRALSHLAEDNAGDNAARLGAIAQAFGGLGVRSAN